MQTGPLADVLAHFCWHGLGVKQAHLTKGKKLMGQQQTVAIAGSALRRIILVLTVAALIVAIMAASAMPADASRGSGEAKKGEICAKAKLAHFCGIS
jgi:hypothetical protein